MKRLICFLIGHKYNEVSDWYWYDWFCIRCSSDGCINKKHRLTLPFMFWLFVFYIRRLINRFTWKWLVFYKPSYIPHHIYHNGNTIEYNDLPF